MNKNGFSLVEVMIGLAMLGGVSLGVLKLSENQRKAFEYQDSKGVELDVYNQVRYIIASKDACLNTLEGLDVTNAVQVSFIKNDSDNEFIKNDQRFGNAAQVRSFELLPSGLATTGAERISTVILRVSIDRLKGIKTTFSKDILLTVKTDANDVIQECLTEEDSVFNISKKDMCESVGGVFTPGPPEVCDLNCPTTNPMTLAELNNGSLLSAACLDKFKNDIMDNRYTIKTDNDANGVADTMTGDLSVGGAVIVGGKIDATNSIRAGSNTHQFLPQNCATGSIVTGFNNNGLPICADITCPANSYFRGLSASGVKECETYTVAQTCPANQYVERVNPNGSVVCAPKPAAPNLSCSTNSYLQGINSTGTSLSANCQPELGVDNFTCPTGQALYRLNSGNYACRTFTDNNVFGATCPDGEFLKGFNNAGTPDCVAPPACTPNWTPTTATTCPGTLVAQTDGCGNSRNEDGTSTASSCSGAGAGGGECTDGDTRSVVMDNLPGSNAGYSLNQCCLQGSGATCTEPGHFRQNCVNGIWEFDQCGL